MPRSAACPRNWRGWKKKLATSLTRGERLSLVEHDTAELPLVTQTELLSLNRSSL
jgi:hypothetical protein